MSNSTNSSSDQTLQFICAFSVSGQYGKTVRFLIYPLIVLSTLYRTSPWLAGGCLTTIFTYCVVASIHSSAMATFHSSSVLDLDCLVAFHLCVIGLIVTPGAIQQATSLRVISRRVVISMFTILLWTGVVSFAATARYHPLPQNCQNTTGPVNVNDTWAIGSCTGRCSQYTLPMRSGQSAQNVVYEGFFYAHKDRVAIIMACLLTFWVLFGFYNAGDMTPREKIERDFSPVRRHNMSFFERRNYVKTQGYGGIIKVTAVSLLAWSFLAEIHLINLPQGENSDAVGQWGPLAASLLVGLGAWIKAKLDDTEKKTEDTELGHLGGNRWPR
ncbi:hypothetical protein ABVK25_003147 [Lepraria finkii]|uniref:Uncharacterized protein n=1 Tax=Lepraria finkii TaxID=1340010 RepID=A0ABR4BFY5_9LECA